MELKTLEKLKVELELPRNVEIKYFSGKYLHGTIERNEAWVDLHTLHRGCLTEWSKYFYMQIEQFDKANYEKHVEKTTYHYNACEKRIVKYEDQYKDYEKYELANMTYYVSSKEIYFERNVVSNGNVFVIVTAHFDKRMDRRKDYTEDISSMIAIMNSLRIIE